MIKPYETWVEIDLGALRHNLQIIHQRISEDTGIIAVLKGNAYGHDMNIMAQALQQSGIKRYAVATINEGIELSRLLNPETDIHILGSMHPDCAERAAKSNLINTICTKQSAKALASFGQGLKVHINLDLGMNRVGCPPAELDEFISYVEKLGLNVEGLYGHLPDVYSDNKDTNQQIERFKKATDKYQGRYIRHLSNSPGLFRDQGQQCTIEFDYVRIGSALYGNMQLGFHPQSDRLQRLISWKVKPSMVQKIYQGEGVGYDSRYVAEQDGWLATFPVGYVDGIPPDFANEANPGKIKIGQDYFPIVGKLCMDHIMVKIPEAIALNTECIILSATADEPVSIESIAKQTETTATDIISGIHPRVTRCAVNKK